MKSIITDDSMVAGLTVGQLKEALKPLMDNVAAPQTSERHYEYGLRGLCKIFDCSMPTALRLKNSGKIDAAIKQIGRKIVVDSELALELAGKTASKTGLSNNWRNKQ